MMSAAQSVKMAVVPMVGNECCGMGKGGDVLELGPSVW